MGVAGVSLGVLGVVQVSPPESASGAAGRTSKPNAHPLPSSVAAADSAAQPHQSKWHNVLAGPEMLAGLQELMSWKESERTTVVSHDTSPGCTNVELQGRNNKTQTDFR